MAEEEQAAMEGDRFSEDVEEEIDEMLEESDDNNGVAEQLAEAEASEAGSGSVPGASVTGA